MNFKQNTRFEILTPTGFRDFAGIRKLQKDVIYTVTFSNGKFLKCSHTHKLISYGVGIEANQLTIGVEIDSINTSPVYIESISIDNNMIDLYDILEVDNGNLFIVDDIVSHNCDFVSSGHTVVDGPLILEYEAKCEDPIERRGIDGNYWIWEYPDYDRDYIVVADVARGDAADYSAFHIFDVQDIRQVGEYKGKIPPNEFGNMLVTVATEWNNALLAIENANIGWAAIQPALDRGYQNLHYTYKDDGYTDASVQLKKGYDMKDKSQMVPGVSTTARTRPLMISALDMYMREKTPIIRSKRLIQELLVFIWLNGKAQSQQGYNDDLVMAFCITLWLRDTALKLRQQGIDLNRRALSSFKKTSPVIYTGKNNTSDIGWNWDTGFGDESLTWLIK